VGVNKSAEPRSGQAPALLQRLFDAIDRGRDRWPCRSRRKARRDAGRRRDVAGYASGHKDHLQRLAIALALFTRGESGTAEQERYAIAEHVVDQLMQRGDPWGLNEEAQQVPPHST
jgi:hypothetical protein